MTDTSEEISPQELSRRQFMDRSIKAIGAFIGITMGVSAAGYLISPALQPLQAQWLKLARVSQVETGIPTLFTVTLSKTTGWVKSEINLAYFVYTEDAVNFMVMSNICTHWAARPTGMPMQVTSYAPVMAGSLTFTAT